MKFFTHSPYTAETYASGGGGNRGRPSVALYKDVESDAIFEQRGDILVQVAGKDKGKELPADMEKLNGMGIYPTEDWNTVAKGANIRKVALDVNKVIDARHSGYDRYGKKPPIDALADLDSKGNRWAARVINEAKKGDFDWSNTKYKDAQKAWEEILIPQLEAKGYDAIKYWDDGHETLAVFSNKSIKPAPVFNPKESAKDIAMSNILRYLAEKGIKP